MTDSTISDTTSEAWLADDLPATPGPEQAEPPTATGGQEHVRAERVEISQGGAGSVDATTVSIQQGGAGRIRATDVSVSQGGVGLAQTKSLRLGEGASSFAIVSDRAEIAEGASVFMLLARSVSGEVRPVLDWRAAAAFGAAFALVLRLLRR